MLDSRDDVVIGFLGSKTKFGANSARRGNLGGAAPSIHPPTPPIDAIDAMP